MDFTDNPNEEDSGKPTSPPAETAKLEAPASAGSPFFLVNLIIYGVIALLVLIFCVKMPCSQRQCQGNKVGRHEDLVPLVTSSSLQSENSSLLEQDEATQDCQDPQDVQGLPQAQRGAQEGAQGGAQEGAQEGAEALVQTQEPGDGDVTKRPGVRHVPCNDSVVLGARECDYAGDCVNVNEPGEEMRDRKLAGPSADNEESVDQDGCAKNAQAACSSGEDTKQTDDDRTKGATSSPSTPPSAHPNVEKDNMTLVYLSIHSLEKVEEVLRARGAVGANSHSKSGQLRKT